MNRRLLVLHTNDVHGRVEGLTRAATLIERARRENPDAAVVYLDAGDVEETTSRLSNLTKGVAMHRLLHAAGCRAVAVGNGAVLRSGPDVLAELAEAVPYPHLAANLLRNGDLLPGARPAALIDADGISLGVVGVTLMDWPEIYEVIFGCERPPPAEVAREHARRLREQGADVVIVLSHLGAERDRALAEELNGEAALIVGGHSHTLLARGERVGDVVIVQAGSYAEHVGVVELSVGGREAQVLEARVLEVGEAVPQHPGLLAEIAAIERELETLLSEVVGRLDEPLELAYDRDCSSAQFMADVVRERLRADVGLCIAGTAFNAPLPAGLLTRGALYEACESPGVPAATMMTGEQLQELVAKGRDPAVAADVPHSFRGRARGLMHVSGAEWRDGRLLVNGKPVDLEREYRVASTDYEVEGYGGYAKAEWNLQPEYESPLAIVREVVEEHLARQPPVEPSP